MVNFTLTPRLAGLTIVLHASEQDIVHDRSNDEGLPGVFKTVPVLAVDAEDAAEEQWDAGHKREMNYATLMESGVPSRGKR